MDLKATALLKLIYLEMFGNDMSWASFHVLEVMSSQKYLQKRVGYLAAVQSFRPDTEVLMLATNLLKKDVAASLPPTVSLPLISLPHIISSSLALSLLSDINPRLSHSSPNIRKKAVATLYRLALVYPDSLKLAWPKIKDRLMDVEEDSSVTAAIVNVICELGWRRPKDFLSLAPKLFELLVDGGNNWMSIKIIKLFASLTPLEPRLIKKLLPPLTNLIRTTPAMSLLYECINGIIQGGILEGTEGVREGEEMASLCVSKLRGMIIIDGDPNLRYVALLAFSKIVASHPHLVAMQEDVIMSCIDDPDISIRLKALDLSAKIISSENLMPMIERLMKQLQEAPYSKRSQQHNEWLQTDVEPTADSDEEDPTEPLRIDDSSRGEQQALPTEHRTMIIRHILEMCSHDTYSNMLDFEWYVTLLLRLFKVAPSGFALSANSGTAKQASNLPQKDQDIFQAIGRQLQNVAVRVVDVRPNAVEAAVSLLTSAHIGESSLSHVSVGKSILVPAAWIAGEYVRDHSDASMILNALLHPTMISFPSGVICSYLQAIPKVFAYLMSNDILVWDGERRTMTRLQMTRIVNFLEPLSKNSNLDVQERAVQFLELFKVGLQAISYEEDGSNQAPLLLTKALPTLFSDYGLNPVAPTAQRKVPIPSDFDWSIPINFNLSNFLLGGTHNLASAPETCEFSSFYNDRPILKTPAFPALDAAPSSNVPSISYQQMDEPATDGEVVTRRRLERHHRNKDDPFYIGADEAVSDTLSPFHQTLQRSNGEDVDIDAIPIMDLDLGSQQVSLTLSDTDPKRSIKKRPKKSHILQDVTIGHDMSAPQDTGTAMLVSESPSLRKSTRRRKAVLGVDSSELKSLQLDASDDNGEPQLSGRVEADDEEMAKALAEVEHLRLEMQRAVETVQATDGAPTEGTLVKKKKRRPTKTIATQEVQNLAATDEGATTKRKKKKKRPPDMLH
ncbi:uncharacterized protein KY384_009069 [Bacidia gigantensis]|uniref:uncharacterized protein n=1 Tax=Bacidia gigantensis TaxID=2732470 RepID=UPI001D038EE1|nr:uncharacterized protein KY384_009069 [Bacidia gigantensis]KAG8525425.1 hypothetical protein KY384_009069 [Bacidia gigantensis]